jgi:hypothetical protein
MKLIKSKKAIVLLASLVVVAAAAIGAYAYFSNTGSGSNSAATVGSVTNEFTVAVADPTGGTLYPTARDSANKVVDSYDVTVTNNDEAAENLHQIIYSVAGTSNPGCTAADFSVGGEDVGLAHTVVYDDDLAPASDAPANAVTHSVTLQMIDSGASQDDCQGVTVTLQADAS